jgi:hypothetical protein
MTACWWNTEEFWMRRPSEFFATVLSTLENAFRRLETTVPRPKRKDYLDGFVFRYTERTIQQAIVQKLARMISGLHAVETLLERGLFQEQGMVQRCLDEIDQDIWFLSFGIIRNDITPLHTEFLHYFYAEEFDEPSDIVGSHKSRGMVRREKIRAYIERDLGSGQEAAAAKAVGKVLTKAYSGFIHAASPHIMDMYGGLQPQFDVNGASKPFRYAEFGRDALSYFYRAVLTMALAGRAFGDENMFSSMRALASELEPGMHVG